MIIDLTRDFHFETASSIKLISIIKKHVVHQDELISS